MLELVKSYDTNGDGVFQLDELEALCKDLEPSITKKMVLKLFKEALSLAEKENEDMDALSPEVLVR